MAATAYNRLHLGIGIGIGAASSSGAPSLGHPQLTRSLERILEEAHFSGELILTNRKLKDFPKICTKYSLTDTVIADLSRNRFCELPEEITTFAFLETLLLYHNAIRSIPESVKQLSSLTYLDLRSNQLSSLPREICFLPLQVLLVSNNRLATLPDELGRLDQTLAELDASYNQLSALPVRLGELRSLRSLSLRSNQLMYLPRELTCLCLISLDVSNNRIASLPLEIRHMGTLVELQLENNPLTSPPASLCKRGLVHVFKFLETQATKDEKGSRSGGNYDGYTTLRRAPRHNSSGNVLEATTGNSSSNSQRHVARHQIDSGYSTSDGLDKRWSHDNPGKSKTDSPLHSATLPRTVAPSALHATISADLMDASLTSSTSTIVDESLTLSAGGVNNVINSPTSSPSKQRTLDYSSSNGSSPDHDEDIMLDHQDRTVVHGSNGKLNKSLNNIQTYKEYKEALKQQRNQEISIYKQKHPNANNSPNDEDAPSSSPSRVTNGCSAPSNTLPKSIMKQPSGGGHNGNGNGIDDVVIPKKPIQKVIPSRNTELMATKSNQVTTVEQQSCSSSSSTSPSSANNADCLGYVKPHSPMKNGVLTNSNNNSKFTSNGGGSNPSASSGIKSPITSTVTTTTTKLTTVKTHRTVTWNHDIPAEKLSFTMRREFDRQREETELMSQLRIIIETRLKMTLPEDIASSLTDGVILCHLANYVRPRSVASIHVPSPGVNKLTMARCRRNVDNFLEACRRIGVDEELICSCADVVPQCEPHPQQHEQKQQLQQQQQQQQQQPQQQLQPRADDDYDADVYVNDNGNDNDQYRNGKVPNALALLRTVAALIAMDANPHHQHMRYQHQQQELQMKLQQSISSCIQQQEQMLQQQQQQLENVLYENCENQAHMPITSNPHDDHNDDNDDDNDNVNNIGKNYNDNGHVKCKLYELPPGRHQHSQLAGTVSHLLRQAKQKTYEKIKNNLLSAHGQHNFQSTNNNNNRNSSVSSCGLQTIVENEHDVASAGPAGHYQLIDEKEQEKKQSSSLLAPGPPAAAVAAAAAATAAATTTTAGIGVVGATTGPTIFKRIEFFEQNGVTKPKLEVFSIYRVGEQQQRISSHKQEQKHKMEQLLKSNESGTSFLKHDSHTLTIILSCVFMFTFLWLVFFPLPG